MKNSRKIAALCALGIAGLMLTGCGANETQNGKNGTNGNTTAAENGGMTTDGNTSPGNGDGNVIGGDTGMTGDIDGDGFIEDVVTGAEDIVDDAVTGAEDIVEDIIPGDGNGNSSNR